MRLSREDIVPLAAIIAAGCVGALATFATLRSSAPLDHTPSELRVENDDFVFNAVRIDIVTRPTAGFYRDLIERIEAIEARQREVGQRVGDLALSVDRGDRAEEIDALRSVKQDMIEEIRDLERELDRARRAQPSPGFRALGVAGELIRESRLQEKIRYSRRTLEQWDPASAIALEQEIEAGLQTLREQFVNDSARGVVLGLNRSKRGRR